MAQVETNERVTRSRRRSSSAPALTPAEWLLHIRDKEPEIFTTRDYEEAARLAPPETLIMAATAHFQLMWNRILMPAGRRAADHSADAQWARERLLAFIDGLYSRLADLTKTQAMREIGAVARILADLKPRQRLRDAMTREQFQARYIEAIEGGK
jgi:hypothetical protein